MSEKTCKTCAHFIQHYRKDKWGYWLVYCGHCMEPRLKTRHADTPACQHYREASPTDAG